ncbi:MAG: hypothetical protein J6I49_05080 [Bacteroidales bacterium]|nr:hypothetical protein [Bacteroidales bacterium]
MKQLWIDFKQRPLWRKALNILSALFAITGAAILGAWAIYQLGITNNSGAIDRNHRSLMTVSELEDLQQARLTQERFDEQWALQYGRLAALARYYPENARLMLRAAQHSGDPLVVDRMIAAAKIYMEENPNLDNLASHIESLLLEAPQQQRRNVIPWMDSPEWVALKQAILRDSILINEAGRLTGVEPRLIVGCLIGEQIRLFNSDREKYKRYLGPVKALNVQSQFSYGVNGIKERTAEAVEQHLKDPTSEYYMGRAYEHLLDYPEGTDLTTGRYHRLVDYGNHLYSYLYTGCILHQTMLQWRRAGYDISDRPDILFTLFNVGFKQSVPKPDPVAGGSRIMIGGRQYTFGAIGFDFYYSGEMCEAFPYRRQRFSPSSRPLTPDDISRIQLSVTDCQRPGYHHEYRRANNAGADDTPPADPFGIDHSTVRPIDHIAR